MDLQQRNYRERPAMVVCLAEHHDILYGGIIIGYRDHNHLILTLSAHMVMCVLVLIQQYNIYLTYVQVKVKY